jgi:hypothetical protein
MNEPIANNLGSKLDSMNGYLPSVNTPIESVKEPELSIDEQEGSELGLRLISKDDITSDEETQLVQDVTLYVRSLLKTNKKREALSFLREHKDHLNPAMKDMVISEIKENIIEQKR